MVVSHRTWSWARNWADQGHDVVILTTRKNPLDGPLNMSWNCSCNQLGSIKVLQVPYPHPWALTWLKKKILNNVSEPVSEIDPSTIDSSSGFAGLIRRKIRPLREITGAIPEIHDPWIPMAIAAGARLMSRIKFHIVVSTYHPPAPHCVALALKKLGHDFFWIIDFAEMWSQSTTIKAVKPFSSAIRWLESTIVANGDLLLAVSDPWAQKLKDLYPKKEVLTIENGFSPEDIPDHHHRYAKAESNEPFIMIYSGTIWPGEGRQNPDLLFRALEMIAQNYPELASRLELRIFGKGWSELEKLNEPLVKLGMVRFMGTIDRLELRRHSFKAHCSVIFDWDDPEESGVIPAKAYEYMASGRPILCLGGHSDSALKKMIVSLNAGLCPGHDIIRISETIKIIANGIPDWKSPAENELKSWSREYQSALILKKHYEMTSS
jgi:hypothetical protein